MVSLSIFTSCVILPAGQVKIQAKKINTNKIIYYPTALFHAHVMKSGKIFVFDSRVICTLRSSVG